MLLIDHEDKTAFYITKNSLTVIHGEENIKEAVNRQKERLTRLIGKTREEYIRTCSTEELVTFLCNNLQHDQEGTLGNLFFKALYSEYPINPMNAYREVMRWLKEKHNDN